jgi:hypothetical protein
MCTVHYNTLFSHSLKNQLLKYFHPKVMARHKLWTSWRLTVTVSVSRRVAPCSVVKYSVPTFQRFLLSPPAIRVHDMTTDSSSGRVQFCISLSYGTIQWNVATLPPDWTYTASHPRRQTTIVVHTYSFLLSPFLAHHHSTDLPVMPCALLYIKRWCLSFSITMLRVLRVSRSLHKLCHYLLRLTDEKCVSLIRNWLYCFIWRPWL